MSLELGSLALRLALLQAQVVYDGAEGDLVGTLSMRDRDRVVGPERRGHDDASRRTDRVRHVKPLDAIGISLAPLTMGARLEREERLLLLRVGVPGGAPISAAVAARSRRGESVLRCCCSWSASWRWRSDGGHVAAKTSRSSGEVVALGNCLSSSSGVIGCGEAIGSRSRSAGESMYEVVAPCLARCSSACSGVSERDVLRVDVELLSSPSSMVDGFVTVTLGRFCDEYPAGDDGDWAGEGLCTMLFGDFGVPLLPLLPLLSRFACVLLLGVVCVRMRLVMRA
jgi:hypothetical protein